jgi:hypothetical protein
MSIMTQERIQALRDQLAALRARHDGGAIPHATYDVVRQLETEIAWLEHRARHGNRTELA